MSTSPTEQPVSHRVLLVDDDDAVRDMMNATLEHKGFEVVAATNVTDGLRLIATESFDVLITDLHMLHAGEGFTVVTAVRHSQPAALTLLVSGYPDVRSAMAAILLEADEIIVKPLFGTRQNNMNRLDFSLLLLDAMAIADDVDSQLTQSMDSYMKLMRKTAA
jgi:DNA-binding NtrC family response regulator